MTTHYVDEETGELGTVDFTAQRATTLCGRRFVKGDIIRVHLRATWDEENGIGEGGPWGWGGYTARTLRRIASRIDDAQGRYVDPIYEEVR